MADEGPRSKSEMMERVANRWDELQRLLDGLSVEQFEQPLGDGWSAKAHVGHLAAWEGSLLSMLRRSPRAPGMGLTPEQYSDNSMDAVNAIIATRTEALPASSVRADANRVHSELVALLETMTEAELTLPYSHYQPDDPPYSARPIFAWVNGNTWGHYEEHIGWLLAGLQV